MGGRLQPNFILTLKGDLATGKTPFIKGFAQELGAHGNVNSPTFTVIKEYSGKIPLFSFF